MGMYTELNLGVSLRADTPENIIDVLKYMLGDMYDCPPLPEHPLFETDRWTMMLKCDSYSFDGHADSSMIRDKIDNEYKLNVRCSFKNYDDEIHQFLDFIRPYLETEGFLGYTRYEEYEDPTLIYNDIEFDIIKYQ